MAAPAVVGQLVERFESYRDTYRSGQYNEAQLREEFLNPFFQTLGWDVYNKKGYAEAYKEVIHEGAIQVGGCTKAPDYCFRVGGGVRSFFVEAKKPSVDIRDAVSPAYQLRRYAWSAKLPVSILTDFEEWAVYDCRIRPAKTDRASTARVIYHTYNEYPECWDELAGLFSPDAIRRGSLDKFVASKRVKKGTAEVDNAFLNEIQTWREVLARNIALLNPKLSQRDLNFAVQRTIDRIVFLRICEDRGIEPYGTLQSLLNGENVYRRLAELFQRADDRYNSGLFHFMPEKGRPEPPDELTLALSIDDRVLGGIIRDLYYPDSPYEFSVFPAEILGHVYEQFLGKVIRLTKGHRAVVEDKPEVKKAGGVYYTPAYIVDYIVQHTVGKLLGGDAPDVREARTGDCPDFREAKMGLSPSAERQEPKAESAKPPLPPGEGRGEGRLHTSTLTPKQAARLRILDPACGSGSFLIGAYECLLKWHRDWYTADDPEKHARGRNPKLYRGRAGDWRLTTAERKRILLNNIHGVDIDPQAVEVTKLSLLLKVLEGESQETLTNQLRLFHERALPDLSANIKCGNSLIGPDFYQNRQMSLLDEEETYRINAFDWEAEFPEILKPRDGGFDAVIANPPYVRSQLLDAAMRRHFDKTYCTATRTYDIYVLFVERALGIASKQARIGFILPNKFFTTDYGEGLRKLLAQNGILERLVDFEDGQVFPKSGTYATLMFLSPAHQAPPQYATLGSLFTEGGSSAVSRALTREETHFSELSIPEDGSRWTLATGARGQLLLRLQDERPPLRILTPHIFQGLKTSADKIYMVTVEETDGDICFVRNQLGERVEIERSSLKPVVKGEHIQRYAIDTSARLFTVYPYTVRKDGSAQLLAQEELTERFPRAWDYLRSKRHVLGARDKGKWGTRPDWYAYARAQNITAFVGEKLLIPYMTTRLRASVDWSQDLFFVNITTGGYGLKADLGDHSLNYLLGILNSNLANYAILQMTNRFRGGYFAVNKQGLERLPFRPIDFADTKDRGLHDRVVARVQRMLQLHTALTSAATAHEKTVLQRQIEATDGEIDRLVYELYGLSNEEIAIVEEGAG